MAVDGCPLVDCSTFEIRLDPGLAAPVRTGVEIHPHRGKPGVHAANTYRFDRRPSALPQVPVRWVSDSDLERVFEQIRTLHQPLTVRQAPISARRVGRAATVGLVAPAHGEHLEARRHRHAEPGAGGPGAALEELLGVEVLPAEAVDVGPVRLSEATPRSKVAVVSTACRLSGEPAAQTALTPPHGSRPSTSCSVKIQRLPASRTASSVARPVAMWSAWLSDGAAPGVAEVVGDHDLRPVLADHGADRPPQRHAVLQDAVGQPEELDRVDPDDPGRLDAARPRGRRASSGARPSMPASPLVTIA